MSRRPDTDPDEGFIGRWSRRKTAESAQKEDQEDYQRVEPDEEPLPLNQVVMEHTPGRMQTMVEADRLRAEAEPNDAAADKPALTDADMPPLESLNESSDFSGFLSPGVSEKLRRAAMRKLFTAAVFNVRDGLDDYDEDFTNFEPLGDIVTSDMKHQAEVAERRRREAEEAAADSDNEAEAPDTEESSEVVEADEDPQVNETQQEEQGANDEPELASTDSEDAPTNEQT